jgi:hypothetical protein
MRGKSQRQLKWLGASHKKKIWGSEVKEGKAKTEPSHAIYFHNFIFRLWGMWGDIRG